MALSNNALITTQEAISVIQTYPFLSGELDFTDIDVLNEIDRLINQWSSYVETVTGRSFGIKTYTEYYKGTTYPELALRHFPVTEIVSISLVGSGGAVLGEYDLTGIEQFLSEDDLKHGLLYTEPSFGSRYTAIGVVPEVYNQLRTYKIVYKAGYILPKNETLTEPSTLPYDLRGLVVDLVKTTFINATDNYRANNLITLTEGNVQRMWGAPVQFSLTKDQEKVLASYKLKSI